MKASYVKPFAVAAVIIVADQLIKLWVVKHMYQTQKIHFLGDRGMLYYTLNNGMAWGMEFGGDFGKLVLTFFRIFAVCAIGYGIYYLVKHKYHRGLILNVSLIFAGAMGNIIDSTFYGILFQGGKLFHGMVVDMFYFPLIQTHFPHWFPIWGGTPDDDFIFSGQYLIWPIPPYPLALSSSSSTKNTILNTKKLKKAA